MKKFFFCVLLVFLVGIGGIAYTRPDIVSGLTSFGLFKVANVRWPVPLRGMQSNFQKLLLFHEYKMVTNGVFSVLWGNFLTRGVVFHGNYIFAGTGSAISVFDASDPEHITLKKTVPLSSTAYAVAMDRKKELLYVASGYAGLSVLDISKPEETKRVGWLILPQSAYARWLAYSDPYVYIATENGCMVVDVRDAHHPVLVRQLLYEPIKFVWVDGNTLYVTLKNQRIFVYDIAQRGNPAFISKIDLSYPTAHNEVDPPPGYLITIGKTAYVANGHDGLAVVDVKDPKNPRLLKRVNLDGKYSSFITFYKNLLSVQTSDRIFLFDITKRENPVLARKVDAFGGYLTTGFSGNRGIFIPRRTGFYVVDVSKDLLKPKILGSYFDKPTARSVYVRDNLLYLANGSSGLKIYTLSNPDKPQLLHTVNVLGYANGIASAPPYLYVSEGLAGVSVIKADHTEHASVKTRFDLESVSWNVAVHGNYAYVCSSEQGLNIYDIKDPGHPVFVGRSTIGVQQQGRHDYILNIALHYPYAYLVAVGGLYRYNVSNPRKPVLDARLSGSGGLDVALQGNTAYVAGFDKGIQIVDLKNTRHTRTSFYRTGGRPTGLHLSGNRLYVADFDKGLLVFDVQQPGQIKLLKTYKTHGNAREVYVQGNYAYVADWETGLTVVNLSKEAVL